MFAIVGNWQGKHHSREQARRERLTIELSPVYQAVKDAEHRRQTETRQLDLMEMVVHHGLTSGADIRVKDVQIKMPRVAGRVEQVTEESPLALPVPVVPTFRELLLSGNLLSTVTRGQMLLGYTGGAARYGSWLDLYSCAIGGVSGSGKSTTVRFLLFQAILASARLVMIDPHIHDEEESLAAQFRRFTNVHIMPPCDDTSALVLKRIRYLSEELAARKATGRKSPAIVLVVDEFNAVMRDGQVRSEMATLLLSIAQEGRKFGLFAMLLGQRWSHQDIGGAAIRTSLASMLAHRFTDEEQARKLIGGRNGPRCLELPTGHYLFRDTNGSLVEMVTPLTTAEDGALVAREIGLQIDFQTGFNPVTDDLQNDVETGSFESGLKPTAVTLAPALDARASRIREMLKEGFTPPQIVREIWGVQSGGAYTKAMQELSEILGKLV